MRATTDGSGHAKDVGYRTSSGVYYVGLAEQVLKLPELHRLHRKVDLILTSPPFPLNRKKRYGNLQGAEYLEWLASFAPLLKAFLKPRGSIVMELGNAWEPGQPVMSTLPLLALLRFQQEGKLQLCQEFVAYNPARLPTPVQWVNIERIRAKDAYTRVWWMASKENPKADNRRVLQPYSLSMRKLLARGTYNAGRRPSDHVIGEKSFLTEHAGAIPSNVITVANTSSSDPYLTYCRAERVKPHPARMNPRIAQFFIKFLTQEGDLILDPFAGSNTTGAVAENLGRRWVAVDASRSYMTTSRGRFPTTVQVVARQSSNGAGPNRLRR